MAITDLHPGMRVWAAGELLTPYSLTAIIGFPADFDGGVKQVSLPLCAIRARIDLDEAMAASLHMSTRLQHMIDAVLRTQAELFEAAGYKPPKPGQWLRPAS